MCTETYIYRLNCIIMTDHDLDKEGDLNFRIGQIESHNGNGNAGRYMFRAARVGHWPCAYIDFPRAASIQYQLCRSVTGK